MRDGRGGRERRGKAELNKRGERVTESTREGRRRGVRERGVIERDARKGEEKRTKRWSRGRE